MSEAPWSELVTTKRILELHSEGIARYGGAGEVPTPARDCVDGAAGSAWHAELYGEAGTAAIRGLSFAAHLLYYLAKRHCFTDGNKRVAWLSCIEVLKTKNLTLLEEDDSEPERLILGVLRGDISRLEVETWLAARLVYIQ